MNQEQLAIDGGDAVFPAGPPDWPMADDDILNSIRTAVGDGSWGHYEGKWTDDLAAQISRLTSCEHVMLCSSGTIAVEIALRAVDVKPNSEVILAAYDFPGNFRAIESIGARPVIVDVVSGGWVIDSEQIAAAITNETSAVIVSHLHGQIADCHEIKRFCLDRNVRLVEDACQTPGGELNGRPLGSFGDVGVFSFGGSKLLSAGRGGAVFSQNADFFQRAKIFCNRGNEAFPLSQLQAAALIPQLEKLAERNQVRRKNSEHIINGTNQIESLKPMHQVTDGPWLPAFYKLPWLIGDAAKWTRHEFITAIQAEGVAIDVGFRGFTRRSPKRCRHQGSLINSRIAAQQTIILHHPILLESEPIIEKVVYALTKVGNSRTT